MCPNSSTFIWCVSFDSDLLHLLSSSEFLDKNPYVKLKNLLQFIWFEKCPLILEFKTFDSSVYPSFYPTHRDHENIILFYINTYILNLLKDKISWSPLKHLWLHFSIKERLNWQANLILILLKLLIRDVNCNKVERGLVLQRTLKYMAARLIQTDHNIANIVNSTLRCGK